MSEEELLPSKTKRKREALRLQKLGQRLTDLTQNELSHIDLPDRVQDAIALFHRISSREARRRQLQYLGRLMRDVDIEPIEAALESLYGESAAARYTFHQLEHWRDRLLAEPESLTEYLATHPTADRQRLRQQLKRVAAASDESLRRAASRELFKMLREFSGE